MDFWATFRGFGPLFYLLWGFRYAWVGPPPTNSGILGIHKDLNIITITLLFGVTISGWRPNLKNKPMLGDEHQNQMPPRDINKAAHKDETESKGRQPNQHRNT